MNRIPSIRLVLVVTTLTALLTVPTASARGLESPRPGARVEAGWLGTAMRWLEEVRGLRLAAPRAAVDKEDTGGIVSTGGTGGSGGASTSGGTCIDPQGRPRPLCDV